MSNSAMSGFVQPKNTRRIAFFVGYTHENLDHPCSRSGYVRGTFLHLSTQLLKLGLQWHLLELHASQKIHFTTEQSPIRSGISNRLRYDLILKELQQLWDLNPLWMV
jgi:hypothetical protein